MVVLPAFALPIIRTRNWIFGIRRGGCCVSIGATEFGKARVVDRFDPVLDRWFTRSSWFTFLICRPYGHQARQSCNQAQASQRLTVIMSSNAFATFQRSLATIFFFDSIFVHLRAVYP